MRNYFTYDGIDSRTYGVYISGSGVFDAPDRRITKMQIPGRNGDLLLDDGAYNNTELIYPAFIVKDFDTNIAAFRNSILSRKGYCKLIDSYHPDEYRMARPSGTFEVTPGGRLKNGRFDITFDCRPERFLTSGDTAITLTASGTVTNPTLFESKPLIVVTGSGTLTVNGVAITISGTPTTIDCESMEAYNGSVSRNGNIALSPNKFPVLSPGKNTISLSTGITKAVITPRWWRL